MTTRSIGSWRYVAVLVALASAPIGAGMADEADRRPFLDDASIRALVVGHDFAGRYNTGKPWAEDYHTSGTLKYREMNIDVDGYWTLADGVFCTFYNRELGGGCWRVLRVSANCFEFYGVSRGPGPSIADAAWTARGWKTKEAPTCGAPQIS
ncbi:MAG TPA: hypothetical protein PK970_12710 [Hyphomicrobiaceae bacterium]|nr:hypothetical protein [Hyphomicrobiaceae bacterium]